MSHREQKDEERRTEALRAIDRVQVESETIGSSSFVRMAHRARDHFAAADKDEKDAAEVWGARIGRTAGLLFAIGLVIHLFVTYM